MNLKTLGVIALACVLSAGAGFQAANVRAAAEKTHYERDEGDLDLTRDQLINEINGLTDRYKEIARNIDVPNENDQTRKAREKAIGEALKPLQLDLYVLLLQAHALSLDTLVDKGGPGIEFFVWQKLLIDGLGAKSDDLKKFAAQADVGYGGLMLGYAIATAAKVTPSEVFTHKADNAASWLAAMQKYNLTFTDVFGVLKDALQE